MTLEKTGINLVASNMKTACLTTWANSHKAQIKVQLAMIMENTDISKNVFYPSS